MSTTSSQITIRDVLIGITILACFLACFNAIGVDNAVLWVASVVAAVYSACYVAIILPKTTRIRMVSGAVLTGFFGFLALSCACAALLISLFCHFLGLFAAPKIDNLKHALLLTSLCTLCGFVCGTFLSLGATSELTGMRDRYPIEQFQERLVYEQKHELEDFELPAINSDIDVAMQDQERYTTIARSSRNWMLKGIHRKSTEYFVQAQGFGVARLLLPNESMLREPGLQDIELTSTEASADEGGSQWMQHYQVSAADYVGLHRKSSFDFLDGRAFGAFLPGQGHVGFVPHAFHQRPAPAPSSGVTPTDGKEESVYYGCYFGELLVRNHGWQWVEDAEDGYVIEKAGKKVQPDVIVLKRLTSLEEGAVIRAYRKMAAWNG